MNLFAVKSNTLNRLFHPYGIIRRESKTTYSIAKIIVIKQMHHKNLITLIQKL